jgi:hypothetical protein
MCGMYEDKKFLKTGWAIKVPIGNDELYVTEYEKPVVYKTKREAEEAARFWKRYKIVYFEGYV